MNGLSLKMTQNSHSYIYMNLFWRYSINITHFLLTNNACFLIICINKEKGLKCSEGINKVKKKVEERNVFGTGAVRQRQLGSFREPFAPWENHHHLTHHKTTEEWFTALYQNRIKITSYKKKWIQTVSRKAASVSQSQACRETNLDFHLLTCSASSHESYISPQYQTQNTFRPKQILK